VLEEENWERLPVPEGLRIRELEEGYPLSEYPKRP
jgi:hypothetical protein